MSTIYITKPALVCPVILRDYKLTLSVIAMATRRLRHWATDAIPLKDSSAIALLQCNNCVRFMIEFVKKINLFLLYDHALY